MAFNVGLNVCSGLEVIKYVSCSTQLSMICILPKYLKLLTITYYFLLNIHVTEQKKFSAN